MKLKPWWNGAAMQGQWIHRKIKITGEEKQESSREKECNDHK